MNNEQSTSGYQEPKEEIILKMGKEKLLDRISMLRECLDKILQHRVDNPIRGTSYTDIGFLIDNKEYNRDKIIKELEILDILNEYI